MGWMIPNLSDVAEVGRLGRARQGGSGAAVVAAPSLTEWDGLVSVGDTEEIGWHAQAPDISFCLFFLSVF